MDDACRDLGLEIRPDKCVSYCFNGEKPLPRTDFNLREGKTRNISSGPTKFLGETIGLSSTLSKRAATKKLPKKLYNTLSATDSCPIAISSVHVRIEGRPIGQHPIILRVLKGAYNICPPKPRYQSTWKVSQVVQWLDSQKSANLPLLDLSMKTVTLCVLTRPCRAAELANPDFQSIEVTPEGSIILPLTPPKQCRVGNTPKDYFYPSFEEKENICPSSTLHHYCMRTQEHRREGTKQLFLTSTKPHKLATSATIAWWIKQP